MALRVLFIGGNGIISSASSAPPRGARRRPHAAQPRPEHATRPPHRRRTAPPSAMPTMPHRSPPPSATRRSTSSRTSARSRPRRSSATSSSFEGRCGQYVYISSASAYQKPVAHLPITESTPLRNPFWQYSRDKIASEDLLVAAYRERGFPATIIRPSHTYDGTIVPLARRLDRHRPDAARASRSSCRATARASGRSPTRATSPSRSSASSATTARVGEAFHITSDEVLTWNQIGELLARAAGAEFRPVHVASDAIARELPE